MRKSNANEEFIELHTTDKACVRNSAESSSVSLDISIKFTSLSRPQSNFCANSNDRCCKIASRIPDAQKDISCRMFISTALISARAAPLILKDPIFLFFLRLDFTTQKQEHQRKIRSRSLAGLIIAYSHMRAPRVRPTVQDRYSSSCFILNNPRAKRFISSSN
jgi:hypothetical protein